jgi:hypothetical protein
MKLDAHLRDEELADEPSPEREAHLRGCAACRQRREAQLAVRLALRALSRDAAVPAAVRALLETQKRATRVRRLLVASAFAALLVAAAASVLVGMTRRPSTPMPSPLVDELALDHIHYEHRADLAEVRGDPAILSSYFGSRLGFAPHYGTLEAANFEGGKPCRIAGKWTALVWLDRAGHWLSLFAMPEHHADRRGCALAEGVRVCASPDPRGGARVLVGDLPEEEMLRLVDESLL